jgi:hypothetical protein
VAAIPSAGVGERDSMSNDGRIAPSSDHLMKRLRTLSALHQLLGELAARRDRRPDDGLVADDPAPSHDRDASREQAIIDVRAARGGNAVNVFVISRRFQDEVAEKRRVDDLENRLNEALELVERYRKRVDEIAASKQGSH